MTTPAPQPLRLGFIGGGATSAVGYTHYASTHLDGLFQLEAGVFSRNAATNAASAKAYGIAAGRMHPDWQTLLQAERGRLDALAILTPMPSHAEIVIAALEAGFPVICEKPLGTSRDECVAIQQAVEQNQGFLAVTFNYSGYPMVRELRALIHAGELGEIQQIHAEMPQEGFARRSASGEAAKPQAWRLSDYAVPTVALDLGVHVHHLIHFLTGAHPLQVIADQSTYGNFPAVVDNVNCLARYSSGISANIWFGKAALGYRNGLRIRVFGSKGSAEWLQVAPEQLQMAYADGRRCSLDLGSGGLTVASQPRYNRFKPGHPSGFIEAFANLYTDIARQLRIGSLAAPDGENYVFGADHAVDGLDFFEAAHRSAQEHSWQHLGRSQDTPAHG
ncbi:gfo/Idh/MocA family oxidoreductase [Azoarcus sp. TTM-91]|uniref:Gfo/Idh/MocA family protein n=1 Tax=Azoarcus sp. TTM-91 TaxID=2691581 RepID=UPI00145D70DC|nr:Gfo/Idh/MocA family oxidoreductase [Azoarcus sp. TTM-91]NMG33208.1 gfo/Idh/MocA family oxidoreductase [Azoarcus sp. TTM-91]